MGLPQNEPTHNYIDNKPALKIINDNASPTERARHMNVCFISLQDWRIDKEIIMTHIPGTLNPSDDLTKGLAYALHARHCNRYTDYFC